MPECLTCRRASAVTAFQKAQRLTASTNKLADPDAVIAPDTRVIPRVWALLQERAEELRLRHRATTNGWRFTCPSDSAHDVTITLGSPGLALTCHGPRASAGEPRVGHSLVRHGKRHLSPFAHSGNESVPFPCRWCGCTESQVLAALGATARDKYR